MKSKTFWLRLAPVLILVAATIIMSAHLYDQMIKTEEEVCWDRLEVATRSTASKIETRIKDNMNFLTAVADAYIFKQETIDPQAVSKYLNTVVEKTLFERIDVILPDESLLTQDGPLPSRGGISTYAELVNKGTHITPRRTSSFTGEEIICGVTPILRDGEVRGLLVGTISCSTLNETFEVFTFGKSGQLFMIDQADGNYLMDNWHDHLGNIHDIGMRQSADGRGLVNMVPAILNGEEARFAFFSQTNGERSYQYSTPVEPFHWTVCVVVQENVAFANAHTLRHNLLTAGAVLLAVVLVYLLWNIAMNMIACRSEEKIKRLEYEKAQNDARAKFISNMSHDIKTPLNGIVGMLQIIQNHRSDEEKVDDCLQKIGISAQYLSTLTSDILDISEIENDKLILPEQPIDLKQLMEEVAALMERQAHDAGVTFMMDCTGLRNPHVLGSSVHVKRILVNLIGNAIKYSKKAGQHVWVTVTDETANGQRLVHFVVKDNGIGMSEEFQKHMYHAFEQETIDARSEYQGYGLGLTIVSHLIKKMKGSIALQSAKGQGSTFTVSIPFLPDAGSSRLTSDDDHASIAGLRLLLVEDNEFNMEIARVLLTDAGADVDMAANGQIATEMFAASVPGAYDAIIMDVMMPVMDGCEATKVIRSMNRPDARTVPVIAMTASTFAEDIARCKEAGMNEHIPKPMDAKQLMNAIAHHTKQSTRVH